jgi:hypothetical protein
VHKETVYNKTKTQKLNFSRQINVAELYSLMKS